MNKQEVIEIIEHEVVGKNKHPEYDADFSKLEAAGFKIGIEEQVGGEDEGSHYHVILKLKNDIGEFFVECDGYYQSFNGTEWDSGKVFEVEKKKIEKEVWAKKND